MRATTAHHPPLTQKYACRHKATHIHTYTYICILKPIKFNIIFMLQQEVLFFESAHKFVNCMPYSKQNK